MSLQGKVVLVTAAAHGIGKASALALARAGATVHATDIDEDALQVVRAQQSSITIHRMNVRDRNEIDAVVKGIGAVDILFNCAGYVQNGTVLQATEEDFDVAFDLNVKSMLRTVQAVLPGMLERGDGSIINVASVVSSLKGVINRCSYGTTKAAVIGLTKSIAADFVTQGIRCNAICPGTVQSPSLDQRLAATGDYDAAMKAFVARQPMGRLGTPDEIADLVVYLAGARYTTGSVYAIDGGMLI
ncbi:SDR family oxidoreductase [Paenalcaligenes suwonensis]|uniref:SDR family oxidoreductase n=1 Tax=Paenalcaligenes suwonensis TaxID=1202713 RepID=UPI001407F24F|nr:SDR family oxidoreductase [Paenalcaligenes suwonensis]NHC60876.1 SDR family oxidoreductase [Paenalcaligenes suwonensis]